MNQGRGCLGTSMPCSVGAEIRRKPQHGQASRLRITTLFLFDTGSLSECTRRLW